MVVKTKFNRWLFNQKDFYDYQPLADLARDASLDPDWPAVRKLDDMLDYFPHIPADNPKGLMDAMVTAWCQWRYEETGVRIKLNELIFASSLAIAAFDDGYKHDREQQAAWRDLKHRLMEGEQVSMAAILGREN